MADKGSLDAIDQYLWDASIRLRGISDTRRARVLAEAQSHLRERAAELLATPRTAEEAASDSVARFGEMKSWTRSIVNASYLNERTVTDRWLALAFVALAALVPALIMGVLSLVKVWQQYPVVPTSIIGVSCVALFAASYRGRQYLIKPALLIGLACLPIAFIIGGITGQIQQRRAIAIAYRSDKRSVQEIQVEADLLKSGLQFYQGSGWQTSVPANLRSGGEYIVPANYWYSMGEAISNGGMSASSIPGVPMFVWSKPFTHLLPGAPIPDDSDPALIRRYRMFERNNTVATAQQAAHIWRKQAPFWLNRGVPYAMAMDDKGVRQNSGVVVPFDVSRGGTLAAFVAMCVPIILVIQLFGAALGRRVYVNRETRQHAG